jgi:peptidyl-prolyl cis-trans isomerase D
MAKNPKQPIVTKKHLARQERERRQQRIIIICAVVVVVLIVGVLLYGFINERFLKAQQPVAVVNGDSITTNEFQSRVRYNRQDLIGRAINAYQIAQLFGDSPETQANFVSQISTIQNQLDPLTVGRQTLDQQIDETLIQQEAEQRGITVSEEELDQRIQNEFGFYSEGTPTPTPTREPDPTSTFSPLQLTLLPPTETPFPTLVITPTATPTATATSTLVPTITPTRAPTLTPTPYTRQLFEEQYQQTVDNLKTNINFNERDLRNLVRGTILREKVQEAVLAELGVERTQEQVWARHILVPDEALANVVLERLNAGEDWSALAAEYSTDTSNKDQGGDLGWFVRGRMVPEFEDAAFSLEVGEISQPVQTSFGYHIIQVLGHEQRPLSDSEYENQRQQRFAEWLQNLRDESDIVERDTWQDRVPEEPAFPIELIQYVQQFQNQAVQTVTPPTQPAVPPTAEQ